jgi:hypothetical protein
MATQWRLHASKVIWQTRQAIGCSGYNNNNTHKINDKKHNKREGPTRNDLAFTSQLCIIDPGRSS